jgi:hypothetical protein
MCGMNKSYKPSLCSGTIDSNMYGSDFSTITKPPHWLHQLPKMSIGQFHH